MTLRSINVPNPAVGADWSTVIPGQYVVDLVAVRATLTTLTHPSTLVDSSANLNDLAYVASNPDLTWGVTGPFGGGGGSAVRQGSLGNGGFATGNNDGRYDQATFSFEALINAVGTGSPLNTILAIEKPLPAPGPIRVNYGTTNTSPSTGLRVAASNFDVFTVSPGFSTNAWHHVAATYDGAQWIGYADGVAAAAVAGHPPQVGVVNAPIRLGANAGGSGEIFQGSLAAVAYYAGVLSGATVAAHNAARAVSAAAYRAAVLADTPIALWMLDQLNTNDSRVANLRITDGTNTVADLGAALAASTAGPFTWTWQTGLPATAQLTGGSVNLVGIPPVVLPPGYTIGTHTLDLTASDQWSNITVWWDDRLSPDGDTGRTVDYTDALILG